MTDEALVSASSTTKSSPEMSGLSEQPRPSSASRETANANWGLRRLPAWWNVLVERVARVTSARFVALYALDASGAWLRSSVGLSGPQGEAISFCSSDAPLYRLLRGGQAISIEFREFASCLPKPVDWQEPPREIGILPTSVGNTTIAALVVGLPESGEANTKMDIAAIGARVAEDLMTGSSAGSALAFEDLSTIIEALDDLLFIVDMQGNIMYSSPSAQRVLGYRLDELLGKPITTVHPPETHAMSATEMQRLRRGQSVKFEMPTIAKDGSSFATDIVGAVGRWNDRDVVIAIGRNVQDRVDLAHRLQQLNQELKMRVQDLDSVLGALDDILIVVDMEGLIQYASPSVERVLGYTLDELVGAPITKLHPTEYHRMSAEQMARLSVGKRVSFEMPTVAKDGSSFATDIVGTIGMWNGRQAVISVGRNVQERVCLAEELRQVNAALEKRVEARTRELRVLAGKIVNAQEEERKSIARALHNEVGQQMALLTQTIDSLVAKSSDQAPVLSQLRDSVVESLSQLRDLSYSLYPPVLRKVSLNKALSDLCERLADDRFEVVFSVSGDGFPDDQRLNETEELAIYRLVQEGLVNAIRHGNARNAWVSLDSSERVVSVAVEDNGCGFDVVSTGFGLGLSSLIERFSLLEGNVEVQSNPGEGTLLSGFLPR